MTIYPCVECGQEPREVLGEVIYPRRDDLAAQTYWLCSCGAYVGSHKGGNKPGWPLGSPCGPRTRAARSLAHKWFDPIWRDRWMDRHEAYAWLAGKLGIVVELCHVALMDEKTATAAYEFAREFLERRQANMAVRRARLKGGIG